jgi:hypothetical protein
VEHTLKLGEWVVLGRGWLTKRRIMFAGEPSPGVYSIAIEWTEVHNSACCNLYFQKGQYEFPVFDGRLTVLGVTKHELRFKYEK